ncbi:hypothetical protein H4I95_11772 [Botrytis cinerea]
MLSKSCPKFTQGWRMMLQPESSQDVEVIFPESSLERRHYNTTSNLNTAKDKNGTNQGRSSQRRRRARISRESKAQTRTSRGCLKRQRKFPLHLSRTRSALEKARAATTIPKISSHQSSSAAPGTQDRAHNDPSSSTPVTTAPSKLGGQRQIPAPHDLTHTHRTTELSILSSSQIQKKASRILSILSTFSFSDPAPHVVLLSAKAPVAGKLITIAEIAKRELAKTGAKWFQYNVVGELTATISSNNAEVEKTGDEKDGDTEMKDGEEEEEAFETMKTPFERVLEAEDRPKIRAVPTFTLYLSRVRIESLRKMYGEQTNALT